MIRRPPNQTGIARQGRYRARTERDGQMLGSTATHRRYRITEATKEIQMRRVAGYLFGFIKSDTLKDVTGSPPR